MQMSQRALGVTVMHTLLLQGSPCNKYANLLTFCISRCVKLNTFFEALTSSGWENCSLEFAVTLSFLWLSMTGYYLCSYTDHQFLHAQQRLQEISCKNF